MMKHRTLMNRFGLNSTCEGRLVRRKMQRKSVALDEATGVSSICEYSCLKCGQPVVLKEELWHQPLSTEPKTP